MVADTSMRGWAEHGFSVEVKHTFLQVACNAQLTQHSRRQFPHSCPEQVFESDDESESQQLTAKAYSPNANDDDMNDFNAVAVAPQWPGGNVTVKNTFICIAFDHDQDQELTMWQAARRRAVQSCPYVLASAQPEDDASVELHLSGLQDPFPEGPAWELMTPSSDDGVPRTHVNFMRYLPEHSAVDSRDNEAANTPETCAEYSAHKHVSTRECDLLHALLLEDIEVCAGNPVHKRASTWEIDLLQHLLLDDLPFSDQCATIAPSQPVDNTNDDAVEMPAREPHGLLLTTVPRKSISECIDDAPTPVLLDRGSSAKHDTQSTVFFHKPAASLSTSGVGNTFPSRQRHGARVEHCAQQAVAGEDLSASPDIVSDDAMSALTRGCTSQQRRSRGGQRRNRLMCHMYLDPLMLENGFDLVQKLIGKSGCNTRGIFEATKTKIRVRGRGSGHKEAHNGLEAPVPLHIALSADHGSIHDFTSAFLMTKQLVHDVCQRFEGFLRHQKPQKCGSTPATRRFWIGEISEASRACLGGLTDGLM